MNFNGWAKSDEPPLFALTEPVGTLSAALVAETGLEEEDEDDVGIVLNDSISKVDSTR